MTDERHTVLVAEDERDLAAAYETWLADEYEVRTVFDGETALERYDESVDVALLDRRMPGLSGDEVLAAIRERPGDCRVAMVTAVEPDFDVFDLGFDDYLVKPVLRDDLQDLVERLLRRAAYDDAIQEQFALVSKLAVLEQHKEEAELAENEEYARLQRELDALDERIDERRRELTGEDFTALLRDQPL